MNSKPNTLLIKASNFIFAGLALKLTNVYFISEIKFEGSLFWFHIASIAAMIATGLGIRYGYLWIKDLLFLSVLVSITFIFKNVSEKNSITSIFEILYTGFIIIAIFLINKSEKNKPTLFKNPIPKGRHFSD